MGVVSQQRYWVTGGTGLIGRELVRLLGDSGAMVYAPSRQEFDVRNPNLTGSTLEAFRPDIVIHLAAAGASSRATEEELRQTNSLGVKHLLATVSGIANPPRVILVGSGQEYAPLARAAQEDDPLGPLTEYGLSKVAARRLALAYADRLNLTWVRPFNVFGAGEAPQRLLPYLVNCAQQRKPAAVTLGTQLRDFSEAIWVAEVLKMMAVTTPVGPGWRDLNLGSGRVLTLREFMVTTADCLSRRGLRLDLEFGAIPMRADDAAHYYPNLQRLEQVCGPLIYPQLETSLAQAVDKILKN